MGTLNLPSSSLVYVDTSIIIYSVEKFPDYYATLKPMWLKLKAHKIRIVSSELALLETLVFPLRNSSTDLIQTYEDLLTASEMQLIPVTRSVLRNAAKLRATTSLKTPDAIHAATAIDEGCTLFLTNDSGFRNVPSLPVVILSEVLTS
ncbi:MAG: PIN domain-containing protein [Coleofasciculaceae cyanobacterium]